MLAPGYNVYHYDHIHVDLMRRRAGYRPCRPDAIPGEVVAAHARAVYAAKHGVPAYTGSVPGKAASGNEPVATPGADSYIPDENGDAMVTGSIGGPRRVTGGINHDFDASEPEPESAPVNSLSAAGDAAIRAEERRSAFH